MLGVFGLSSTSTCWAGDRTISRPLYCILIVFVYHFYWYKWIDRFLLDYSVPKNTNKSSLTNYYYISWYYYLSLTLYIIYIHMYMYIYIVISSFHKSRSVNVAPCYLRRDLCHFVIANSGPRSLEKVMLCKSTDKMHSFNRRLSTQVCSCKKIKPY